MSRGTEDEPGRATDSEGAATASPDADAGADGPSAAPEARTGGSTGRPNRRSAGSRPWHRRGRVWFVAVVVSAGAAWGVSVWAEDRRTTFDADRTAPDVALWCDRIESLSEVTLVGALERSGEDGPFSVDVAPLQRLTDQAPVEIRGDVRALADAVGDMSDAVAAVDEPDTQRRELERISVRVRPQTERVEAFVQEVCFDVGPIEIGPADDGS
ncbi:MAG: hypothetical protein JJU45_01480 [Acidimicrobiia bacterium]|nr:hypothetical protein [Acidimicrobiia bacterium]